MITEHDLQEAIAECEGQRNPTANTCIKLAAFYTIRQNMFPDKTEPASGHSYAGSRELDLAQVNPSYRSEVIDYNSGSEFSRLINGADINSVLEVIDDTMSTLSVVNPRFYKSIMNRLSEM